MNIRKRKKGFTLVELIVVIAILALLAAIALPRYNASKKRSAIVAHNANVRILKAAGQNFYANEGRAVTWKNGADAKEYVEDWPTVPKGLPSEKLTEYKEYEVEVEKNGNVTVSPGPLPLEESTE